MKTKTSLWALLCTVIAMPAIADEVAVTCPSGLETQVCQRAAGIFTERTGHTVRIVEVPTNASEALALFQQILATGSSDVDVFRIDGTWQGMMAPFMMDLAPLVGERTSEWFPRIIGNNYIDGKLVSLPANTDAGMLYYRTDLLEEHGRPVPTTWTELTETAQVIQDAERDQGNSDMWGFVWQGRAYEGLTCDALEWIYSHGGGTIIDTDGNVTINNEAAATALDLAASWVGTITPDGVLTYAEEESRGVFQSGNAAFMRNWPYAWGLAQADDSRIKGLIGVTVLPMGEGGQHAATLGGWSYAVSATSDVSEAAQAFVEFITSAEFQLIRALEFSQVPTNMSVYGEPALAEGAPFIASLQEIFLNAVSRPASVSGENYAAVSTEFYNTVHAILSGSTAAAPALEELEGRIARALVGR